MRITRTIKTVCRRSAVLAIMVSTVLAATGSTAQADPISDLLKQAHSILATAPAGSPLKVVVTTRTDDAPDISAVTASSASEALRLITAALKKPSTIGVDMAQPVRMTGVNDPYRRYQWALTMFGAEIVWNKSTGKGVVVAVVDTGVEANHPDLRGRVLPGRDFIEPGTSANDENGHGTHVSGIIAATVNNRILVAGLAPNAQILPVRVLDAEGSGDSAGVAQGIIWAAQRGANVINLSLGTTSSDSAMRSAVAYAQSRNAVVVAAAGNDGCTFLLGAPTSYPAAYDGVLGVGAITSDRRIANYSSCGSFVDVVAPGSSIVSTMIRNPDRGLGCTQGSTFCALSGTSMATPYAAAVVALEVARLGHRYPQASLVSRVQSLAIDLGPRGRDDSYGAGLISPYKLQRGY